MAGVDVYRAGAAFEADGKTYAGRDVRRADVAGVRAIREGHPREADLPGSAAVPDVSRRSRRTTSRAWSLGMLLGVEHVAGRQPPVAATARLEKLTAAPTLEGHVTGNGSRFVFDYRGPDAARAINALLKQGARAPIESSAGEDRTRARLRSRT